MSCHRLPAALTRLPPLDASTPFSKQSPNTTTLEKQPIPFPTDDLVDHPNVLPTNATPLVTKNTTRLVDALWTRVFTTLYTLFTQCYDHAQIHCHIKVNKHPCTNTGYPCKNRFYADSDGKSDCDKCASEHSDFITYQAIRKMSKTDRDLVNIKFPVGFTKTVTGFSELDVQSCSDESDSEDTVGSEPPSCANTSDGGVSALTLSSSSDGSDSLSEPPDTLAIEDNGGAKNNTRDDGYTVVQGKHSKRNRSLAKAVLDKATSTPQGATARHSTPQGATAHRSKAQDASGQPPKVRVHSSNVNSTQVPSKSTPPKNQTDRDISYTFPPTPGSYL